MANVWWYRKRNKLIASGIGTTGWSNFGEGERFFIEVAGDVKLEMTRAEVAQVVEEFQRRLENPVLRRAAGVDQ